jgi:hypothetical protein
MAGDPTDDHLRAAAAAVLRANRGRYATVPAPGLYPYQWCWDTGPIALGWAALGDWDQAWRELRSLLSAQWPTGFVPHIVFWEPNDEYFPGPDVWATEGAAPPPPAPPTTGITQPPLPVSAAAAVFAADPDRARADRELGALLPHLVAWIEWVCRGRRGPHGAVVAVHPWETGMDNSPAWDEPLAATPKETHRHLERRDTRTVAAVQRPTTEEYQHYLGIVAALRAAGWDTEHQSEASPFAVEDPGFTAIAARAADDLAAAARASGDDQTSSAVQARAEQLRAGLEALWDDERRTYRAFDVLAGRAVGPATAGGLVALWAGCRPDRAAALGARARAWTRAPGAGVMTSDPDADGFDPVRYWRGPVWVLVNWLVAEGARRTGDDSLAEQLRLETRALVAGAGFSEYYDPRDATGIGGTGFSWSAALTLWWIVGDRRRGQADASGSSSPGSAGVTTRDDGPAAK